MPDFKAKYEIDDGYAGGSRPQGFRIRECDYDFQEGATDEQILEIFYDAVDEDMRQKVSAFKTNEAEFLEWARAQIDPDAGWKHTRSMCS